MGPPPPPPTGLGWRRRRVAGDQRRGPSTMTAELQQDDAAGAADRHGSVGPVGERAPGARRGRVPGQSGAAGAGREGAAESARAVGRRG